MLGTLNAEMDRSRLGEQGVTGRARAGCSGTPDALCSLPRRCRSALHLWKDGACGHQGATQSFSLESCPQDKLLSLFHPPVLVSQPPKCESVSVGGVGEPATLLSHLAVPDTFLIRLKAMSWEMPRCFQSLPAPGRLAASLGLLVSRSHLHTAARSPLEQLTAHPASQKQTPRS